MSGYAQSRLQNWVKYQWARNGSRRSRWPTLPVPPVRLLRKLSAKPSRNTTQNKKRKRPRGNEVAKRGAKERRPPIIDRRGLGHGHEGLAATDGAGGLPRRGPRGGGSSGLDNSRITQANDSRLRHRFAVVQTDSPSPDFAAALDPSLRNPSPPPTCLSACRKGASSVPPIPIHASV